MKKRIISVLMALIITLTALTGKILKIINTSEIASTESHIRVKELDVKRGNIYDRNGKLLVNTETEILTGFIPSNESAVAVKKLKGTEFAKETILKGYFTCFLTEENMLIAESENIKNFNIYKRYPDNTALHILGYCNNEQVGVCGVEKYFNEEISALNGKLSVSYSADALGRMLISDGIEIRNDEYYSPKGISLTIDKKIQTIVENALINGNITKGAAVVLEAKTSAILACASAPTYERDNIEGYLNNEDSPFLNRALCAFPVGSVFKAITAAAAIESGVELKSYICSGSIEKSGNIFNCNKEDGHGKIDLTSALALSCNPYFIELSTQTDSENLLSMSKKFGFSKATDLGNGFLTDSGILPTSEELNSNAAIGNFGFGQGKFTATPLQIAAAYAVFANEGTYNEPYLLSGEVNSNGAFLPKGHTRGKSILKKSTCKTISSALLETTLSGTGKGAYSSLFNACTKTATAQSGQYNENGTEIKYCWFVGYFPYENPEYVVCILKENGSSGGTDGAPVFKEISEKIYIEDLKSFY